MKKKAKTQQNAPRKTANDGRVPISEDDHKTIVAVNNEIIGLQHALGANRDRYLREEAKVMTSLTQKNNEISSVTQALASKLNLNKMGGRWTLSIQDGAFIRQPDQPQAPAPAAAPAETQQPASAPETVQ